MTTHNEALSDYRRFRARQAGVAADTPPGRLGPDPEHAAALEHASRLLTPAYRHEQQQRRAADAAAERPAGPPPREVLRAAHQARTAAQGEVERLRQAAAAAAAHLTEATATRDAAKNIVEADAEANTAQLIADLTAGGSGRVEVASAGGAERVALAEAEHQVEIAARASDKLGADLAAAQQRLSTAETKVSSAVSAMLLNVAQAEAEAILRAADDLDSRRADLDALGVVITAQQRRTGAGRQPWPASIITALQPELRGSPRLPSKFATPAGAEMGRRWSAIAAALLVDAEAPLAAGES